LQIDFKNSQQKKFYYIKRAIMMGNIFIAFAVILYLSKSFWVHNMSTSQDQYISSLKKIKQVEEEAQKEIDSYKSKIEDQIIQLESELEKAIAVAKSDGEKLVDSSVADATKKSNAKTQKTIEEAKTKSKDIASQITAQNAQDIINILLKGVE